MRRPVLLAFVISVLATPLAAQRAVSLGVSTTVPSSSSVAQHAATLELGARRIPVRLRLEASALILNNRRSTQAGVSLLLPLLDRSLSPYLLGGVASETDGLDGPDGFGASGIRTGAGLRYRVGSRVLFIESLHHTGIRRNTFSLGTQF